MSRLYRSAYHVLSWIGAPVGGIRPRRIYHWLARRGFRGQQIGPADFRWYRDRWGYRFLLHPFYHIDRSIISLGCFEEDLIKFLHARVRPGEICFDVGANLGQVTVHMAGLVGPTGKVHAFEPVPHVLQRLRRHTTENELDGIVEIHAIALSNENGTAILHHTDATVENQGMASLVSELPPDLAREDRVTTERLDDFVAQHEIPRIDWMKVDIQGAEPLLLEGAAETLDRLAPDILMEVSPEDLRGLGRSSRDLLTLLESHGYTVYEIKGSRIVRRLVAAEVAPDYYAPNVYCTRKRDVR